VAAAARRTDASGLDNKNNKIMIKMAITRAVSVADSAFVCVWGWAAAAAAASELVRVLLVSKRLVFASVAVISFGAAVCG
jgi:hypothetical protein